MQRKPRSAAPLHWDDVRLFLALARARTLGGAARSLGVDSSTVCRRLAALEETMAVNLFDRGRDGITATKAAEDLLGVAEEIEEVIHRFANAADGLEREVAGAVRITCPSDVAQVVVAPLLRGLLGEHPKLRIVIDSGEALLDLTRREADLALRTIRPTHGDLIVTKLATAPWVLAATAEHVRQLGKLKAWTDARWIGWGERMAMVGASRWLAAHAPAVEPVVCSDSLAVQIAALTEGVGVALVPAPSLAHFGLEPVKLAPALREAATHWPADDLFLVTHRALREVPRVKVVWDRLLARLGPLARAPK
jgi:DNA-binding transcriptional LysR family regulator